LERYDLVIPSHAERLIKIAAHDHHEICEVGERRKAIEKGIGGKIRMEECSEEQEGVLARDRGESRNRGGSGRRQQIYEAQGDWACCRRECREAAV
jgi:hypothetical protein